MCKKLNSYCHKTVQTTTLISNIQNSANNNPYSKLQQNSADKISFILLFNQCSLNLSPILAVIFFVCYSLFSPVKMCKRRCKQTLRLRFLLLCIQILAINNSFLYFRSLPKQHSTKLHQTHLVVFLLLRNWTWLLVDYNKY